MGGPATGRPFSFEWSDRFMRPLPLLQGRRWKHRPSRYAPV